MLLFVIVLLLGLLVLGFYFSNRALKIRVKTPEAVMAFEEEQGHFDPAWLGELQQETFQLTSIHGYRLAGTVFPGDPKYVMVFSHGVSMNQLSSVKYMKMFKEWGWTTIIYDHPRHGQSGGPFTTYGMVEKWDLKTIIDWAKERYPGAILGVHGESMGAATILQYGGIDDGADFYIADCPFSNLRDQLAYRLRVEYNLPPFPLLYLAQLWIQVRAGFLPGQVNPLESVQSILHPLLLIHGDADDYIPPQMSQEIYQAKTGPKHLYLTPGARHATSLSQDPQTYQKVVQTFLREHKLERPPR